MLKKHLVERVNQTMMGLKQIDGGAVVALRIRGESDHDGIET